MKRLFACLLVVLIAAGVSFLNVSAACAQNEDTDSFTLEEVTVTAEKRETNLQKTPISMAVIQGTTIQNNGSTSMADILKDIPNVSTSDTGGMGTTINIRGLGMDLPIGVGDSSVSTNFDGAYQARPEANLFGFFDIDRVEVLRGPQGTLYGRNATGGVVNIVTTKPTTDEVKGYVSLEIGDYDKMKAEAAINVPISETLAGRLAVVSSKIDSFTQDSEGYSDSQEGMASRLQLRYMPSEDVSINLLYNYVHRNGRLASEVPSDHWEAGDYDLNNYDPEYSRTYKSDYNSHKIALTADFPLGPGVVTFLPTHEEIKERNSSYGVPGGPGPPKPAQRNTSGMPWDITTDTVELRYANKADAEIQWVGGLYYSKTDDPQVPRSVSGSNTDLDDAWKKFESKAAFAQVTYPFTDTLRGVAGARYSEEEKGYYNEAFSIPALLPGPPDAPPVYGPTFPVRKDFSFSYGDFKVGLEKDLSEDVMGYVTLATGHKAGGFSEDDGKPFDTETTVSGEVGLKSRMMNNRLQVNGDVFYYSYDNYQVVDVSWVVNEEYPAGTVRANFFNADKARIYGAEVDTQAIIGDATRVSLNVAYLKTEYTADFFVHEDPFAPAINLKGETMPHSPEFTIKAGVDHSFSLPDGSTLTPSFSYRWTDEQYMSPVISEATLHESFSVGDVMLTYASPRNWTLNFYSNNVFDEHYYTGSAPQGPITMYFPAAPRTIGATLNVRF